MMEMQSNDHCDDDHNYAEFDGGVSGGDNEVRHYSVEHLRLSLCGNKQTKKREMINGQIAFNITKWQHTPIRG